MRAGRSRRKGTAPATMNDCRYPPALSEQLGQASAGSRRKLLVLQQCPPYPALLGVRAPRAAPVYLPWVGTRLSCWQQAKEGVGKAELVEPVWGEQELAETC